MQIFMKNKKKQIIYLIIFFFSVGGSIWVWLGSKSSPEIVPNSTITAGFQGVGLTDTASNALSGYLPFGTDFETDLFSKPEFLQLRPTVKLIVTPEELGRENPFSANTVPVEGDKVQDDSF